MKSPHPLNKFKPRASLRAPWGDPWFTPKRFCITTAPRGNERPTTQLKTERTEKRGREGRRVYKPPKQTNKQIAPTPPPTFFGICIRTLPIHEPQNSHSSFFFWAPLSFCCGVWAILKNPPPPPLYREAWKSWVCGMDWGGVPIR